VQLQPASVDLRLANEFLVYRPAQIACLDPRKPDTLRAATERVIVPDDDAFILHPGEFALGSTVERVRIPSDQSVIVPSFIARATSLTTT